MSLKPEGFESLPEVADAIASYQPHREAPKNLDGLAKNVRLGTDGKYHWHWDPRFRPQRHVQQQLMFVQLAILPGDAAFRKPRTFSRAPS